MKYACFYIVIANAVSLFLLADFFAGQALNAVRFDTVPFENIPMAKITSNKIQYKLAPAFSIDLRMNKYLVSLIIAAMFGMFYSSTFCDHMVFSVIGLKYVKQIGMKGVEKGQFSNPHSLAVDKFGNILVADTGNKRVQSFSPMGRSF